MISRTRTILLGVTILFIGFLMNGEGIESAETRQANKTMVPGVMRSIRPFVNYSDTYQWSAMSEVVGQKGYDWARDLFYNREIWCLEFNFKPVRIIDVDFPTDKGTLNRVNVWYMVYSVTNTGKCLINKIDDKFKANTKYSVMVEKGVGQLEAQSFDDIANNLNGTYIPSEVNYNGAKADANGNIPGSVQFIPQFILASNSIFAPFDYEKTPSGHFINKKTSKEEAVYNDEFLPMAFVKIATLEKQDKVQYESTITMAARSIKPGETVWGIATWVDNSRQSNEIKIKSVNPRIKKFCVYISGLTNALRWEDSQDSFTEGNEFLKGRTIFRKVLKLNFFKPGDEYGENQEEIYFGQPGELDYQWVYM